MPGYLSSLFGDDGAQSQSDQQHLAASNAADIDQTVGIHQEMGGSYEDANGATDEWSSSHDVSVTLSAHALVAATIDTGEGTIGDSYGVA